MTKAITSVAALQCVEEGIFMLNEPIDEWVPELSDLQVFHGEKGLLLGRRPSRRGVC